MLADSKTSLVQGRLTVLGFILALLTFASSALLSLAGLEQDRQFLWHYLDSGVTPICLGFLLSVSGIASFIMGQSERDYADSERIQLWPSQSWWFSVGQILLYVALAQFLASGMNNFMHGLWKTLSQNASAYPTTRWALQLLLVGGALFVWWELLFIAPIRFLCRADPNLVPRRAKASLWVVYAVVVSGVFLTSTCAYYLRNERCGFVGMFFAQIVQPILWLR